MYKCCIFDLDGTLINSITAITHTINLTLEKYDLPKINEDLCKVFVGDGYKKLVERALIHCGDSQLKYYEDALNTYSNYFETYCTYEVKAYDGIKNLLNYLHENDIKIAVLSNKPHDRTIDCVKDAFDLNLFDYISGEKEGVKRKPDPQGAIIISKELNIPKEFCLYIGDTDTDMKTGIGANMDTIGVTWGFRTEEELKSYNPKYIINHPSQIIDIVESNSNLNLSTSF